jgi:hypothetical protein
VLKVSSTVSVQLPANAYVKGINVDAKALSGAIQI